MLPGVDPVKADKAVGDVISASLRERSRIMILKKSKTDMNRLQYWGTLIFSTKRWTFVCTN